MDAGDPHECGIHSTLDDPIISAESQAEGEEVLRESAGDFKFDSYLTLNIRMHVKASMAMSPRNC